MILALLLGCAGESGDTAEEGCAPQAGTLCTFAGKDGLAALGQEEVSATESYLYSPQDVLAAADGRLYLLDWNNHRVRCVEADGTIRTVAGTGLLGDGPEGDARLASFNHPTGLAWDLDGTILVAAWHNSRVERLDPESQQISFVAGDGTRSYAGDEGDALVAKLDLPSSAVVDADGVIYIADTANQRIRTVTPDGIIHAFAGTGEAGYGGDGGPVSEASFANPEGQAAAPSGRLEISPDGRLFVADTLNQRIRVVDLATGLVDTYAGNGTPGFSGDGGPAVEASLFSPTDIALGPGGELYVADTENSCVRVVDPDGTMRTHAGICTEPDYTGDGGPPAEARLHKPYGVAVDTIGNVYIADTYNHAIRVAWK
ncbi:MAG: hypothetical protein FJ090_09945 [Deltaproteobacteria bacterium]|nr:hypothetical protein [Deltaproteobacteria bacterium]